MRRSGWRSRDCGDRRTRVFRRWPMPLSRSTSMPCEHQEMLDLTPCFDSTPHSAAIAEGYLCAPPTLAPIVLGTRHEAYPAFYATFYGASWGANRFREQPLHGVIAPR